MTILIVFGVVGVTLTVAGGIYYAESTHRKMRQRHENWLKQETSKQQFVEKIKQYDQEWGGTKREHDKKTA